MSLVLEEAQDYVSFGEEPSSDPRWLEVPALEHLESRAAALSNNLREDHEVATIINNEVVPLTSERRRGLLVAEITAAGLTVAGLLLAANHLRVRHKK
ncbi:hypothetical protein KW794_02800 [Candidatus Saccharibacteria bacterium]|nr:hypothetical protein [Candidatus Saccharibacteria bacterium]